jgi:hypothetical protein
MVGGKEKCWVRVREGKIFFLENSSLHYENLNMFHQQMQFNP